LKERGSPPGVSAPYGERESVRLDLAPVRTMTLKDRGGILIPALIHLTPEVK